ncbi:Major Facilitator Superfamily protein [Pseudovibrio axinellae]|uniref:Major Facilitator Superfamily protein n=1 Tax=Pseudovibrio axinellae TaxID=989403 RepID=A0A165TVW8_9HYPH|nr:MFS transporter [Pseudovibrio axinellae]KZL06695.1 Major Facilitator Superfamily protein [Pseudovibrio axinellae]SER60934.1 Predicted arabinose efflux permease, MFS family [Pseudovibrio axinellae]
MGFSEAVMAQTHHKARNFPLILVATAVLSMQMPILIATSALAGSYLAPHPAMATVPLALQMFGNFLFAAPISLFMGRYGRKSGILLGVGLSIVGALLCVYALVFDLFSVLLAGHVLLGIAAAAYSFMRFAASDSASPKWKPMAISLSMSMGLLSAFVGPSLVGVVKDVGGVIPFVGSYLALAGIAVVGALPVFGLQLPSAASTGKSAGLLTSLRVLRRPVVWGATACGGLSFGFMTMQMSPTPLAMEFCGFSILQSSDVIRWHLVAMFGPSFVTGFIINRVGATAVMVLGLLMLAGAGVVGALSVELWAFYVALVLLGIGWNFGFIGASSRLVEVVSVGDAPMAQGANDAVVALVSAVCALSTGILFSTVGWAWLSLVALPLLLGLALWLVVESFLGRRSGLVVQ